MVRGDETAKMWKKCGKVSKFNKYEGKSERKVRNGKGERRLSSYLRKEDVSSCDLRKR